MDLIIVHGWLLHTVLALNSYSSTTMPVAHVAHIARAVLQEENIQEIEWPAVSPDLNPIEPVFDRLDRSVRGRPVSPQTPQDVEQALIEEWNLIPQRDLRRLIRSMPRRCQTVINARGGHTLY